MSATMLPDEESTFDAREAVRDMLVTMSDRVAGRTRQSRGPLPGMAGEGAMRAGQALLGDQAVTPTTEGDPVMPGDGSTPTLPAQGVPDLGDVTAGKNGVPSGLNDNAARGAAAVRQVFGFDGTIGGLGQRPYKSDHPHGNAIDVMTNDDMELGQQVADYFVSNADKLGVKYVIFAQHIASAKGGWKWRKMEDRGSRTANHFDHPHISFVG